MRKILDRVKDKYRKFLVDHYPKVIVDRIWLRIKGHKMNWKNPKDLNEKIQWLKCMSDTSQWSILTDKLRVRDYIESKGYADALPKIYGVWDNVDSIDYALLPQKFVIKCNHDCGSYHIVDKSLDPDFKEVNKDLNNSLKKKFGYNILCEPHYNKISPCIFAEEYLPLDNFWGGVESSSQIDYKFWCFDGLVKYCFVCYDRSKDGVVFDLYDLPSWNPRREKLSEQRQNQQFKDIPRPKKLKEMVDMASELSKGFPQVRVDLYEVGDKIYFGEMTFTSEGGQMDYFSGETLQELGGLCVIPSNLRGCPWKW